MSKANKCPVCGASMPANMRFCGNCGAEMNSERDPLADLPRPIRRAEAPRPTETAIVPETTRTTGRNVWQYILVFAIIAVVIAIAVMLVIRMNQPVEQNEPSQTFEGVHVINADGEEITPTAAPQPQEEQPGQQPVEETPAPTETPVPTETPAPTETPQPFSVMDADDTVYVTGSGVNLRSGAGTTYDIVAIANAGTELRRTGTTDNNWSRVEYEGSECYISNAFISNDKPEASSSPAPADVDEKDDTVTVAAEANVRSGPGTDHEILGLAKAGTELRRTGISGSWSRVIFNGSEGYIYNSLLKTADAGGQLEERSGTLTVTEEANLREGPSTDDRIIAVAKVGTELTITGKVNNWYRVEYEGSTAYINGNLIRENDT